MFIVAFQDLEYGDRWRTGGVWQRTIQRANDTLEQMADRPQYPNHFNHRVVSDDINEARDHNVAYYEVTVKVVS